MLSHDDDVAASRLSALVPSKVRRMTQPGQDPFSQSRGALIPSASRLQLRTQILYYHATYIPVVDIATNR